MNIKCPRCDFLHHNQDPYKTLKCQCGLRYYPDALEYGLDIHDGTLYWHDQESAEVYGHYCCFDHSVGQEDTLELPLLDFKITKQELQMILTFL
jgi:hypothetical protein